MSGSFDVRGGAELQHQFVEATAAVVGDRTELGTRFGDEFGPGCEPPCDVFGGYETSSAGAEQSCAPSGCRGGVDCVERHTDVVASSWRQPGATVPPPASRSCVGRSPQTRATKASAMAKATPSSVDRRIVAAVVGQRQAGPRRRAGPGFEVGSALAGQVRDEDRVAGPRPARRGLHRARPTMAPIAARTQFRVIPAFVVRRPCGTSGRGIAARYRCTPASARLIGVGQPAGRPARRCRR